ncbi:hypothetical protein BGZ96_008855 [Linnemannia gamsii]|uniref:Septin-type G domain-containing protein n=1 Tax=Linnemannia gamsii TaxID=64522 RepID=A0ABQ7JZI9_9FUNG|nr:hypothetical protein BGZ96_008855 [Linnemannia gamsii]
MTIHIPRRYWLDQGASSLNLIMPSSAMFVKNRESTAEGDKLGFVKLMVAGQSRVWNSRLIQDMFRWDGIIANDFDDEFLQDPLLPESDTSGGIAATALANSGGEPGVHHGGQAGSGGVSSNESGSFMEETPGQHQHQRKREYNSHNQAGVLEAIVEHYASSMVLPAWARAGFEDQELHQEILVKNVCIVDTPGYSAFNNPNRAMDLVISYLGLQFQTTNEFFSRSAVSDDSLGRFLANNTTGAHSHVDACLYVIEGHLSEIDIQFMQRLQPWVNLIPILIPPNLLQEREQGVPQCQEDVIISTPTTTTAEMIARARVDLIRQLKEHEIHIYGVDLDSAMGGHHNLPISISSNSSPFTTAESPEADLASPPLLVLDGSGPLSPEFTSPPFIFHVPPSLMEDTGVGQLDRDVLQLDVVTKKGVVNHQDDEGDSDNGGNSTLLPTVPHHRASSALGVQEDLPDLGPLRRWVYVHHLAALRHHTTQKFLSWRRHLPSMHVQSPMESSQDSGSYRQQQRRQHHHAHGGGSKHQHSSINTFSSDSAGPSSYRPALSTATTHSHSHSNSVTQPQYGQHQQQQHHNPQRALPTDLLGDLRAQDQKRISEKVVRMMETQGQVFDRILQERQVAWRQALEGMEREQRIEFLMHELRRWANDGPSGMEQSRNLREGGQRGQKYRKLDVQYREGSRDSNWSNAAGGTALGLGLEAMGAAGEPSLRDALFTEAFGVEASNSVRSTAANISDRKSHRSKHAGEGGRDRSGTKKSRTFSSKVSPIPTSSHDQDAEMQEGRNGEELEEEDPLGLGLWMSRLFGAIGRGLVQVVVMVGMGSLATWIYTHFLEHRVTWIG